MTIIGQKIYPFSTLAKKIATEKGVTIARICEMTEYKPRIISDYFHDRLPPTRSLARFCRALKINEDERDQLVQAYIKQRNAEIVEDLKDIDWSFIKYGI